MTLDAPPPSPRGGFLGVIPARAGSKGIPGKNVRPFNGKPLLHWTIDAGCKSKYLNKVVVTSEDQTILEIASAAGDVDLLNRPIEMSHDDVPGIVPVLHALRSYPDFENVVVLQPTSPLRTSEEIDRAIEIFVGSELVSLATVSRVGKPVEWTFVSSSDGRIIPSVSTLYSPVRQSCQPLLALNGSIYIAESTWLFSGQRLVTKETFLLESSRWTAVDIDEEYDWIVAEALGSVLRRRP